MDMSEKMWLMHVSYILRKMTKIRFLYFTNAPTDGAMRALPDVDGPTNERREKTVVFFITSQHLCPTRTNLHSGE